MKYIYILIVLFSVSLLQSCGNEDSYRGFSETQVKIEKADVSFTSRGGTGTILIDPSEDDAISATADQSWCEISVSGHTITVTVSENKSFYTRKSLITVKSKNKVNYVPVFQESLQIIPEEYIVTLLGNAETRNVGFECDEPIASIESDKAWLQASISEKNIVLTVTENPSFVNSRTAIVKLIAKDRSAVVQLEVTQRGLITTYQVDKGVESIDSLTKLNNHTNSNGKKSSRYKITSFSPELATLYNNVKAKHEMINGMRIETPCDIVNNDGTTTTKGLSIITANVIGDKESAFYWNSSKGLTALSNSNSTAILNLDGNSTVGSASPYANDLSFTKLREIFASEEGFLIIPGENNIFWFRSIKDPLHYFKIEPAQW